MIGRRAFVLGLATVLPGVASAQAGDAGRRIVDALRAQGYEVTVTRRTFLGRGLIEAEGPAGEREIIYNPRTGEILRDVLRPRRSGGRGERLLDRDDDDRDDDDRDDDRDDDGGGGDDDD